MNSSPRETELKLNVAPERAEGLFENLPHGQDKPAKTLVATYFDTEDQALRRAGFSLRLRNGVQTVKSLAPLEGVFGRGEWEAPVKGKIPDRDLIAQTPAAGPLGEAALQPLFTVKVKRRLRLIERDGAQIELALDVGTIEAGDRRNALSEVELELKTGEPSALFDLARELDRVAPLDLSFASKADRGFALLEGDLLRREAFAAPALTVATTAGGAFQAIATACLTQMAANHASLRRAPGPEGVHQLRVATRRLRSALSTFRAIVDDADLARVIGELKWLTGELNDARNLDVFIADTWRPEARSHHDLDGMAAFGRSLLSAQTAAYERMRRAIDSDRFRALMLETAAWVQAGPWTRPDAPAAGAREAAAAWFAAHALERRTRKIRKAGRNLRELEPALRHKVRISAKKLRYAAEDFAPLFPDHPKRRDRFIEALKTMQDGLGVLNDLAFSAGLAEKVALAAGAADAGWAAGRLTGERDAKVGDLLADAEKAFARFAEAKPFW